jgi:hypothetical protein
MADKKLLAYLWMLLKRPGTHLLAVVFADTAAYVVAHAGTSAMAVMTYMLQMLLLYRVWRGANMIPWMLLMAVSLYEGYVVYQVIAQGAAGTAQTWTAWHLLAVGLTFLVLVSPGVRGRLQALRGIRPAR